MENTLIIVSIIAGIVGTTGFVLSIINIVRQKKVDKMYTQEHAEKNGKHANVLKMYAQEKTRTERLMFLTDRIFDPDIPLEFKKPFYEEYISMKGNGTAVRFWQLEAEREKKTLQPT